MRVTRKYALRSNGGRNIRTRSYNLAYLAGEMTAQFEDSRAARFLPSLNRNQSSHTLKRQHIIRDRRWNRYLVACCSPPPNMRCAPS